MRNMLAVLLLAATVSLHAQNVVIDVAPPSYPAIDFGAHFVGEWKDGQYLPCPGGQWQFQNAIINPDNSVGIWSAPKTMIMPEGWLAMGRAANLPLQRAAVIWRATEVSTGRQRWMRQGLQDGNHYWWAFGTGDTNVPFSGNSNSPYLLIPFNAQMFKPGVQFPLKQTAKIEVKLASSSADVAAPPPEASVPAAPDVWLVNCPLAEVKVARSWVTHSGETALSPVSTLPPLANRSTVGGLRRVSFVNNWFGYMETEKIPEGVLGFYLYMEVDGVMKRQLTMPWLADTAGNDKYLHSPHNNQPVIWAAHNGPCHSAATRPCSVVTPLVRAAYRGDSYTPQPEEVIYTPVVVGYQPSKPLQMLGNGPGWRLRQGQVVPPTDGVTFPNDHPTYWPAVITQNSEDQATLLQGCKIKWESGEQNSSRGPGLSIGITGSDFSGGQAFKFRARDCLIKIDEYDWKWSRHGLYVGVESAGVYGHTPSEWSLDGCSISGISVSGGQSINYLFTKLHLIGAKPIRIEGTTLKFTELIAGQMHNVFDLGSNGGVAVSGLFIDLPGYSLIDCNGMQIRECSISNITSVCGFEYFVRSPINSQRHKVRLENWPYWRPGNEPAWLYSAWRNTLDVSITGSDVLQGRLTPSQPAFPWGNP